MPPPHGFGMFTYQVPELINFLSHTGLCLAGAYLTYRLFASGARIFGFAFLLFTLIEPLYMTYHLGWTTLLFVHLLGDGGIFLAFVLIFFGLRQHGIVRAEPNEPGPLPHSTRQVPDV